MKKAIFHPKARADLQSHLAYLRGQGAPLEILLKVFDAIELAREKIERNPKTWSFMSGSRRIRKVQIAQFGLQVVYLLRTDGTPFIVEIIGRGVQPRWPERL